MPQGTKKQSNSVLGIELDTYRPIEDLSYYGQYVISHTGTYSLTPPLPRHIAAFIQDLHSDISCWDGTSGTFGRDYFTHRPVSTRITREQADDLRARYQSLVANTTPRGILEQLRRSLEKQTRTETKLQQAVSEVQRRLDKLRRQRDRYEIDEGPSSDRVLDLDDRLAYDTDELTTLQKAQRQMRQKVLQTELELAEHETGHVRKIALLRRIFGEEPLRGGIFLTPEPYTENPEIKAEAVNRCDEQCMRTSRLLLQAKCFYLDAVVAKEHLYKIESTLRAILENLHNAINAINSGPTPNMLIPFRTLSGSSSNSTLTPVTRTRSGSLGNGAPNASTTSMSPEGVVLHRRMSERGPDFRLRYVRKLWNSIDADFKGLYCYIEATSLKLATSKVQRRASSDIWDEKTHNTTNLPPIMSTVSEAISPSTSCFNSPFPALQQQSKSAEPSLTKQFSLTSQGRGGFGVFHQGGPLLPRFSSIELSHPLNKRARVSALHRCAAKVYKEINLVYDEHEEVVRKALALIQKRMADDCKANEALISRWEELLGVCD